MLTILRPKKTDSELGDEAYHRKMVFFAQKTGHEMVYVSALCLIHTSDSAQVSLH